MSEYTTGKINNPNPSLQVQKIPGSKGVFVGLNPSLTVQTVAKGRVGGTNSPVYVLKSPGGKSPGKVNKPQPSPKMKMGGTKGKKC